MNPESTGEHEPVDELDGATVVSRPRGPTPSGPAPASPASPANGTEAIQFIGGYALVRKLGEGGMGAVYLAEDTKLARKAAIKTMRPELAADENLRRRFVREARAAAAVEHENIVPIWGIGEAPDGSPFIAMPFLQGESLAERLKRQPVSGLGLLLKVAREVAEGLSAAHAKGLIHRDIKPGNVWLDGDPTAPEGAQQVRRVKILDFGLARSVNTEEHQLTKSGVILGTPAFMAPEQAMGEDIDHRVDLFALGVVLFRMATGRMPFAGDTPVAVMIALTTETAPPVWTLNPNLPPALSELIDKLLSKSAADRPATAADVSAAVRRIARDLQARPVGATPPPAHSGAVLVPAPRAPAAPPTPAPASNPATEPQLRQSTQQTTPAPKPKPKPKPEPEPAPEPKAKVKAERAPEPDRTDAIEQPSEVRKRGPKTKKVRKAKAAGTGRAVVAVAVAAVAVVLLVFFLRGRGEGTFEVRAADSATEARLRGARVLLISGGKERYALGPGDLTAKVATGQYTVRLDGAPDVALDTAEVTFKRGETVTVRAAVAQSVANKPDPPKPVSKPDAPKPDAPKEDLLAERRAADYLSRNGATINLGTPGGEVELPPGAPLPPGPIRLLHFRINEQATATDEGLAALAGCAHLRSIDMQGAKAGPAGLAHLRGIATLEFIAITPNFDDAGVATFDGCANLRAFWAGGTKVTDAGIARLRGRAQLRDVRVSNTDLTDAGLAHLKECPDLTYLFIPGTKVTREGVEDFARAKPKCKIEWTGGVIEPREK